MLFDFRYGAHCVPFSAGSAKQDGSGSQMQTYELLGRVLAGDPCEAAGPFLTSVRPRSSKNARDPRGGPRVPTEKQPDVGEEDVQVGGRKSLFICVKIHAEAWLWFLVTVY
ncbi:hypothetical protein GN956_G12939 [Arapaima gigas]